MSDLTPIFGFLFRNGKRAACSRIQPFFFLLVPLAGIELATFALRMRCSTN